MPVSTPNGYLDFTNATPRATKVIAMSNVGIGTSDPIYSLDVMGTANVGALSATSVDIAGGLSLDLPVATIASNLVTYDTTSGQLFDSGGLFSNKLAVVSEQPPGALTGATTTVTGHGRYTVTASTPTNAQNVFAKTAGSSWSGAVAAYNTNGTYAGSALLATGLTSGEWVSISLPYKATLRHYVVEQGEGEPATTFPRQIKLYGSNDEGTSWTLVNTATSLSGTSATVLVNATEKYKKYGFVFVETNNSAQVRVGELRLFAESFSIDGGKIEMATSAVTGGETVVEQTTGHTREPAVLKKYPEVALSSNVQSGYVTNVSSQFTTYYPYRAFDGKLTASDMWSSADSVYNYTSPWAYTGSANLGTDSGGNATNGGEYIQIVLPNKILLNRIALCVNRYTGIQAFTLYGSNDGVSWTELLDDALPSSVEYDNFELRRFDVNTATYYKHFGLVAKTGRGEASSHTYVTLQEWELYGYEETATEGDTSLDTTITSKYNTPDLTSASLYLDGLKGSTATDYSGNDVTVTENNVTWDSTEKSWTLSGAANSNVVSADLGFEGDQPHSVSAWVKADQLNGRGLFHVGTAEGEGDAASRVGFVDDSHISWGGEDHYFSNAEWHNVTYTYNGEGSDKKLYLDGRLVGSAKNEDTFGEYPPFAMTTYSQYGYTASASSEISSYAAYYAFDGNTTHAQSANSWICAPGKYDSTGGTGLPVSPAETTTVDGVSKEGEWIQMEFPQRMIFDSVSLAPQTDSEEYRAPKDAVIAGSNDGTTWETMRTFTGETSWTDDVFNNYVIDTNVGKSYKYVRIIVLRNQGIINSNTQYTAIAEIKFYARRENDLVRFPDPTNVLKYPHVAMTGQAGTPVGVADLVHAQRGYEVTASSMYTSNASNPYQPWRMFDDTGSSSFWVSIGLSSLYGGTNTTYGTVRSANLGSDSGGSATPENGEWVKIKLQRAIVLSNIVMVGTSDTSALPKSFKLYGSNNGTSWTEVLAVTGASSPDTSTGTTFTPSSTPNAYKYFGLVITQTQSRHNYTVVGELKLYGTEPEDVVARIGDGYDGKVRNLRVFSTALSQDRVQEIFDADKDAFGLAKSSVSVYRGHLGIGTTEPKAALTVMDEVGELVQLPPGNMTADDQYFEKHGVFRTRTSPGHITANYPPWEGFNDTIGTLWYTGYSDNSASYNGTSGAYSGTAQLGSTTKLGEYLVLEMPYKVFPKRMEYIRQSNGSHLITNAYVYGRNGSNGIWTEIGSFTDGGPPDDWVPKVVHLNNSEAYDQLAFVPTKRYAASTSAGVSCHLVRYFGTREQGASTLHNGELTLTRNLTVPRIGPPLDMDDTPRRDRLVVEYNTSTNPTESGMVRDTSGRGLDGLMYNGAYYDATEKALVFDGVNDYLAVDNIHNPAGAWAHSVSVWLKMNNVAGQSSGPCLYSIGETATNKASLVYMYDGVTYDLVFGAYGDGIKYENDYDFQSGTWYHMCFTYAGGTLGTGSQKVYVNGVELAGAANFVAGGNGMQSMDLAANAPLYLSKQAFNYAGNYINGSMSNFKLYDVALTATEVKLLYDMGRCDEGGHVVNFSKTRVGIGLGDGEAPRAELDVRGSAKFSGLMSYSVPYYFGVQANRGGYIIDSPIVYNVSVKTNYPGCFYYTSTSNGYYKPPIRGIYKVYNEYISHGQGNMQIQLYNYVTDTVIYYHDDRHTNYAAVWESASASGLIEVTDPTSQAIRIYYARVNGNGAFGSGSIHGCASFLWVSDI